MFDSAGSRRCTLTPSSGGQLWCRAPRRGGCSRCRAAAVITGFPVLHHLLEFAQTHVFWARDAIQPSHPLSPRLTSCSQSFPASVCFLISQLFVALKAGGEADDTGWDGWMASPTQWTWVWVNPGSWWWIGRPGVLQSMGLQRVGRD